MCAHEAMTDRDRNDSEEVDNLEEAIDHPDMTEDLAEVLSTDTALLTYEVTADIAIGTLISSDIDRSCHYRGLTSSSGGTTQLNTVVSYVDALEEVATGPGSFEYGCTELERRVLRQSVLSKR